ncbi:MAG: HAMP domain-containing protein [candidate division Zixibacteria bacterium]|nr:HAMP domain-containing protein [candidate division Zixibacteria bacterium]
MKLKGKLSFYFILATGLPLLATVLILYFYLIGGLRRIESDNVRTALESVRTHFEREGENLSQRVGRALRADDYQLLQILLTKDNQGQIDQSRLIDLTGEYQNLLKLDFLEIISPNGMVLASGIRPTDFNRAADFEFIDQILENGTTTGFTSYRMGEEKILSYLNGQVLAYNDSTVAVFVGGIFLDDYYLREMQLPYNVQSAVLSGRNLFASTFDPNIEELLNLELKNRIAEEFTNEFELGDVEYTPYYQLLYSLEEDTRYQIMLLYPPSYARLLTSQSFRIYGVVAIAGILIAGLLGYAFAQRLSSPIKELALAAEKISEGRFDRKIIWFSNDELGTLVDGFNEMYDRLKRSQQKLIQAEKLAAWNQMARKVAHEIKNPLTPIKISIEDLKRSYRKHEKEYAQILESASSTIINEIDKLKRIVDEFSSFARLPSPDLKQIDTVRLVEDSLKLYNNLIQEGRLIIKVKDDPGNVLADKGLFSQALVNIVKNSFEADPEGKIEVTINHEEDHAIISIKDHGPGISDRIRAQMFTPYFTTKAGGSGLGLVITQRILFDHEADISVNSEEGKGTEFAIRIPVVK